MKILVTAAGPKPAKDKAGYVMDIAKKLGAEVVALHISKEEDTTKGEETLKIFTEAGEEANVNVTKILKKGDIISNIVKAADKESAALIIMGASPGKVADWISAGVIEKVKIPVVIIPLEFKDL